jgi:peptidoglycan/LPS O-acetylase OafA/YrhL
MVSTPLSSDLTSRGRLYAALALPHLPGLDGIRAIAAAMVVINHHDFTFISGSLGVTIFFVLSGFLITWLLLAEDNRFGTVSLRNFYIRRSLRIFPAFYVYCAVVIGLGILTHKALEWPQVAASLLYVNNYYQATHGDLGTPFSHSWSLGIEEQFYLLWPLAFILLRRNRTAMAGWLASAVLVVWAYRSALVLAGTPWYFVHYAFHTRADHLLIGCLLAVALKARVAPRLFEFVAGGPFISLATALLLAASVAAGRAWGSLYEQTIGFAVQPMVIAALIIQVIALKDSWLWGWLNGRVMTYLGTISYSIYLYQQIVPGPIQRALEDYPASFRLAVSLTVILLLASASYAFVERPFLRLKRKFETRRHDAAVVPIAEAVGV